MKVIEFIKENGLEALTEQFDISVKKVDDLLVLNYNQIESPKTHPIVMECRSLILESGTLKVVSRSFDRFFNYGEALNVMPIIDWAKAKAYSKVDGSLIKIYYHNNSWKISTKGTAYGESDCMGYGITFAELVYKSLGCKDDIEFQRIMQRSTLCELTTYIFELTSVENRVVKRYEGYKLHFLASRYNESGEYNTTDERSWILELIEYGNAIGEFVEVSQEYSFATDDDCIRTAANLKDFDEGYVIYQDGVPVAKIKSPAYVAVHHIRGEGLNPKRIMQLVLTGEEDEYLTYFPEDRAVIQPYTEAKENLDLDLVALYNATKDVDDQKEFANIIAHLPYKSALFSARAKGIDVLQAFNDQRDSYKMEILKGYMN